MDQKEKELIDKSVKRFIEGFEIFVSEYERIVALEGSAKAYALYELGKAYVSSDVIMSATAKEIVQALPDEAYLKV